MASSVDTKRRKLTFTVLCDINMTDKELAIHALNVETDGVSIISDVVVERAPYPTLVRGRRRAITATGNAALVTPINRG